MDNKITYHEQLWLTILCLIIFVTSAFGDGIEIFRLEKGLRYSYDYKYKTYIWNLSNYTTTQDSGTIEYFVIDSSIVNDTTVTWQVLEKRTVIHMVDYTWWPDSTYPIIDSTIIILNEGTTGYHELRASSYIWNFPASAFGIMSPVFRYADSSQVMTTLESESCMMFPWHRYDSLWFSSDSGLTGRLKYTCDNGDESGEASWLTCKLLSQISVSVKEQESLPVQSELFPNYPNPANPTTIVTYNLSSTSDVKLGVYDLLGHRLAIIAEGIQQPGRYHYMFDGSTLGSGVYLIRFQTPEFIRTNKIIILK